MIHPNGSMCIVCVDVLALCNHLPFDTYPKQLKYDDEDGKHQQVICKNFVKVKNEKRVD